MANSPHGGSPQVAKIRLPSGDIDLTLAEARQIAGALKSFLETNPKVSNVPMLTRDSTAWLQAQDDAVIDFQGNVRIGLWLLEGRGGDLVLTYRETSSDKRFGYQYIAYVNRKENQWYVRDISWEKIFSR